MLQLFGINSLCRLVRSMINQEPDDRFRSAFFGTLAAGQRFKGLALALSELYPTLPEEKRWADGVLAQKRE